MPVELDEIELRVLGVLIEKSLAHPQSYPLTLNAIVLGASQKQNRDPVVEYAERDVAKALYTLQQRGLVELATTAPGARANRFAHRVLEELHWDRRAQAVMAELMLRGRQTAGELRSRAARMTSLQDLESVANIIDELKSHDPPYVEELPREPGRSAVRFRHLLSSESAPPAAPSGVPSAGGEVAKTDRAGDTLAERVAILEAKVAVLESIVSHMQENYAPPPAEDRPT